MDFRPPRALLKLHHIHTHNMYVCMYVCIHACVYEEKWEQQCRYLVGSTSVANRRFGLFIAFIKGAHKGAGPTIFVFFIYIYTHTHTQSDQSEGEGALGQFGEASGRSSFPYNNIRRFIVSGLFLSFFEIFLSLRGRKRHLTTPTEFIWDLPKWLLHYHLGHGTTLASSRYFWRLNLMKPWNFSIGR